MKGQRKCRMTRCHHDMPGQPAVIIWDWRDGFCVRFPKRGDRLRVSLEDAGIITGSVTVWNGSWVLVTAVGFVHSLEALATNHPECWLLGTGAEPDVPERAVVDGVLNVYA